MRVFLLFLLLTTFSSPSFGEISPNFKNAIYQGDDGDKESLCLAVEKSLNYTILKVATLNSQLNLFPEPSTCKILLNLLQKSQRTLKKFEQLLRENLDAETFTQKIQKEFVFRAISKEGIKLTGYFEPIFSGSLNQEGEFKYPLYRRPDDLVEIEDKIKDEKKFGRMLKGRFLPYYSREEIDKKGVLQGKGYEIIWLKDPWERFLLHVQGSGRIQLTNGQIYGVKYTASNGRPYRSIGQYLVRKGFIEEEELSLRKVKEFFQKYPHLMEDFFNLNERYIFFQAFPLKNQNYRPVGALDLSLIPGRSVATDHSFYPPGALCYLKSTIPVFDEFGKLKGRKKLHRFVLNQDKGVAIKGPSRVDLFIGSGEEAGLIAGEMKEEGNIFILEAK